MPSINYVICTYGGRYERKFGKKDRDVTNVDKFLQYHLALLNKLKNNITQITIMRPRIDKDHTPIENYYDFSDIDISNIEDKIRIFECENLGASYGQLITFLNMMPNAFDYTIFVEDDYTGSTHNFDSLLINEYNARIGNDKFMYLCAGIIKEEDMTPQLIAWLENEDIVCADFSLGIMNKASVKRLFDTFAYVEIMTGFKRMKERDINNTQILFSYLLHAARINLVDYTDRYLSPYYCSADNSFFLINYPKRVWKTTEHAQIRKNFPKLLSPIFLPLQLFYPKVQQDVLDVLEYSVSDKKYFNKCHKLFS